MYMKDFEKHKIIIIIQEGLSIYLPMTSFQHSGSWYIFYRYLSYIYIYIYETLGQPVKKKN